MLTWLYSGAWSWGLWRLRSCHGQPCSGTSGKPRGFLLAVSWVPPPSHQDFAQPNKEKVNSPENRQKTSTYLPNTIHTFHFLWIAVMANSDDCIGLHEAQVLEWETAELDNLCTSVIPRANEEKPASNNCYRNFSGSSVGEVDHCKRWVVAHVSQLVSILGPRNRFDPSHGLVFSQQLSKRKTRAKRRLSRPIRSVLHRFW